MSKRISFRKYPRTPVRDAAGVPTYYKAIDKEGIEQVHMIYEPLDKELFNDDETLHKQAAMFIKNNAPVDFVFLEKNVIICKQRFIVYYWE